MRICHDNNRWIEVLRFEASRIEARVLLQFMGIGLNGNGNLSENRNYYSYDKIATYEVKIVDLGGSWVNLNTLSDADKDLLVEVIKTADKSTAHLTHEDPNGGRSDILDSGTTLILKLLDMNLYSVVGQESQFLKNVQLFLY